MKRTEIYQGAVENFRKRYPQLKAVDTIASRIFISTSKLYAVLEGERIFTLEEEEHFFRVCEFPQGFEMKRDFVFPERQRDPLHIDGIKSWKIKDVSEQLINDAQVDGGRNGTDSTEALRQMPKASRRRARVLRRVS